MQLPLAFPNKSIFGQNEFDGMQKTPQKSLTHTRVFLSGHEILIHFRRRRRNCQKYCRSQLFGAKVSLRARKLSSKVCFNMKKTSMGPKMKKLGNSTFMPNTKFINCYQLES